MFSKKRTQKKFVVLLIVSSTERGKPSIGVEMAHVVSSSPATSGVDQRKFSKKYHSRREGRSADTPNACSAEFGSFELLLCLCCCRREGRHRHHHMWVKHKTSDRQLWRWEKLFSPQHRRSSSCFFLCTCENFQRKKIQGKKDAICSPNVLVHETHPCLLKDSVWQMRSSPWVPIKIDIWVKSFVRLSIVRFTFHDTLQLIVMINWKN